ncbi:MAG: FAD-dependent monooxygenase [Betaproteobacteria bacterium]|jgi:salicylate hydroxylase
MRISIVGGGLGGLTAALALLHQGFKVTVYEQAKSLRELGAGVQLGPNAVGVLYRLGLQAQMQTIATDTQGKRVRLWNTGQSWPLFDLGALSVQMYGYPYLTVHRADLQRVLAEQIHAMDSQCIVLNSKVNGVEQTNGAVKLDIEGRESVVCDLLIGADGVHSIIRKSLFGHDEARQSGIMAWRGVIDCKNLPAHMHEMVATNWVGPGAHVVQYPLRRGALMNFVGAIEGNRWEIESWSEKGSTEECLGDFKGWHEDIQALIKSIETPYKWVLKVRDPMPTWTQGSITLLGDACHPMLPFLAQGAGMALEDGFILARALKKYSSSLPQALEHYESARIARTSKVVDGSNANAKRFHNPALADARGASEYVSKEWSEERVKERYEWLFRYNVQEVEI